MNRLHTRGIVSFLLQYEIRSSWWASLVSWNWAQNIAACWFARKVRVKFGRYSAWLNREGGSP